MIYYLKIVIYQLKLILLEPIELLLKWIKSTESMWKSNVSIFNVIMDELVHNYKEIHSSMLKLVLYLYGLIQEAKHFLTSFLL